MKYKSKRRIIDFLAGQHHATLPYCVRLENDRGELVRVVAWCPSRDDANLIAEELNRCMKSGHIGCATNQEAAAESGPTSRSTGRQKRPQKETPKTRRAKSMETSTNRV